MKSRDRFSHVDEVLRNRRAWADYTRQRRKPTKLCCKCKQYYPNDHQHFASNERGRLRSTCRACAVATTTPKPTPAKQICHACRQLKRLFNDRLSQPRAPVLLCWDCRVFLQGLRSVSIETANRLIAYADSDNDPRFLCTPTENPPAG